MKTNNLFDTGNVKVGDAEALSSLGIQEIAYFRNALQKHVHVDTVSVVLERRKELQAKSKVPLNFEQWEEFWEAQGKSSTIMFNWEFDEDGYVIVRGHLDLRDLREPLPYGIKNSAGRNGDFGFYSQRTREMPILIGDTLTIGSCAFTTLQGFENTEINKDIIIVNCKNLRTLEGLPQVLNEDLLINCKELESYKHLPKCIKTLDLRGCPDMDSIPEHWEVSKIILMPDQVRLRAALEAQGKNIHIPAMK